MINNIAIMGRLTADPKMSQTTTGKRVAEFRIACDRFNRERADFFTVIAWDGKADFVSRFFRKGDLIAVDGRLQSREYQDKQGNNRTVVEISASNLHFCGGKNSSAEAPDIQPTAPVYSQPGNTIPFVQKPPVAANPAPVDEDDFQPIEGGEDLPF